ncbi:MAG TPA: YncE family protein [Gammaproteobacteria bacterium]
MNIFKLSATVVSMWVFFATEIQASPTVYVPLGSGNQVIAVDAETNKITASYSGVENPHGLVATPDGEYLIAGSLKETPVAAGQSQDTPNSQLYLIHLAHGHVMLTIPVAGWTHHQAITPDGHYVISTHATRGYVSVVDLESNQVIQTIKTGNAPNFTLVTRDGKYAYVSNSASSSISEINLKTWKVSRTLEAGASPEHLVFSKDESKIYVANPRAGKVSAISVSTGKLINQYDIGKSVHGLDISDDGKTLFVSSKKEDKLVAVDTANGNKRELKLTPEPYHLNTIKGTGKVYVSSRKQPLIWVIDQKDLKLIDTIKLPSGEAHQMAIIN